MDDHQVEPERSEQGVVDPYARRADQFLEPPRGVRATLKQLGPGMILVGAIVGSGELIMTTKLGAQAGFVLLWFVLLSCLIKVVVQAELARHTISSGKTFLEVFNSLPGPGGPRPDWLRLEWMAIVIFASFCGLAMYTGIASYPDLDEKYPDVYANRGLFYGAIVAGVVAVAVVSAYWIGRRLGDVSHENGFEARPRMNWFMWFWLSTLPLAFINGGAILGGAGQAVQLAFPDVFGEGGSQVWAILCAVACGGLLLSGKYNALERFSLGMVATFTAITIVCTVLLQQTQYAITPDEIRSGLSFDFPESLSAKVVLSALAMYALTGIATGEMSMYTYWCVEKGYARNTGANQPGEEWPRRARGWIRVMYTDVLLTMVVYTVSTVCFYLLGAAILFKEKRNPDGLETLGVLSEIYTESLGNWAATLFVVGAFFVLFSTIVSSTAGFSRILADALCVMRIIDPHDYTARLRFIRIFLVVALVLHVIAYSLFENPPLMLIISSMISVVLYPIIGLGTLYLRHRGVDQRIRPGPWITVWLWICGVSLAVISPAAALLALAIDKKWITFAGG